VAHHADDSIETMLMNLVRGTGLRGLTGIQPRNKKVVRPLLCCTRLELENYLIEEGLDHVEDSSNASTDYQRNKFRNEIIPLLEEVNPSARQTLYDSLLRFEGNLAIYQQAIDRIKEQIIYKTGGVIRLNIELIKQQVHIPTIMYELLQPYGFSPALIEQVTQNLDAESGKIFYSDNYRLLKDRKYLMLSAREETATDSYLIQEDDTELTEPIKLTLQKMTVAPGFKVSKEKGCVHIDAGLLHFPLQLRHWREGDSFFPFGMKQRQKVSDFFINNKLSMLEKEHSWLLVSGEDIVWIVGQRMDNRFRLTDATKEAVEVNCKL
jgi:tRNA(Ile)-lysidine synthase